MRISIVIPTLNEATRIATAVRATAALPGDKELIVVDGGSSDGTLAAAAAAAPEGTVLLCARRGRARQMNAGAALARGDVIVFLHADTQLPPTALAVMEHALRDSTVVGGAFAMRFDDTSVVYRVMAWSNNLRSRRVVTGDQAIFVRATIFRAIGGFPSIPLMEDLALSKLLRAIGQLCIVRPAVVVSARRHRRNGPIRTLVYGWLIQILWALGVSENRLHLMYYGRPVEE